MLSYAIIRCVSCLGCVGIEAALSSLKPYDNTGLQREGLVESKGELYQRGGISVDPEGAMRRMALNKCW